MSAIAAASAACARASDAEARRVDAEASTIEAVQQRRIAIIDCGRKRVLRSEPIVDGDDDAAHVVRHTHAPNVLGVEIARDEPAAVEVHEARARDRYARRVVDANPDAGAPAGPGTNCR